MKRTISAGGKGKDKLNINAATPRRSDTVTKEIEIEYVKWKVNEKKN